MPTAADGVLGPLGGGVLIDRRLMRASGDKTVASTTFVDLVDFGMVTLLAEQLIIITGCGSVQSTVTGDTVGWRIQFNSADKGQTPRLMDMRCNAAGISDSYAGEFHFDDTSAMLAGPSRCKVQWNRSSGTGTITDTYRFWRFEVWQLVWPSVKGLS